jgi:anion-transporting  ArsA/GET3 family ATPase
VNQRLYVISGKGGVGKTIFSLGLALDLISKGKNVLYNHFDQEPPENLCNTLGIPVIKLSDEECLRAYVTKKLGSKILASWVVKAPFFHSLFNILPGLKNLVYLGYLINLLIEDPDLIIVLDSPSSGHALTLLESPSNFRDILKTGPLVKDINIIEGHLHDPTFTRMFILFLPTLLAFHEAEELREGVLKLKVAKPHLVLNSAFSKMPNLGEDIPPFLEEKFLIENLVIQECQEKFGTLKKIIPHIPQSERKNLIKEVASVVGGFND